MNSTAILYYRISGQNTWGNGRAHRQAAQSPFDFSARDGMLMQTTKQRVFKHPQWQDAIANTIILTLGGQNENHNVGMADPVRLA